MIQRIQTLFLLLAAVALAVCMMQPIGTWQPDALEGNTDLFNLCILAPDGSRSFNTWPLFALLLLACTISVVNIFLFKNRKLQMKLCSTSILLCALWMIGVAVICYLNEPDGFKFYPSFFLALPVIAVILLFMARARIKHDEKLVRAADRIR